MRRFMSRLQAAAGILALAIWLPAVSARESSNCMPCHEKERAAETGGVHQAASFGCADCHGGHAEAETKEGAHAAPFQGKIVRPEIAPSCARCHSDVRKMNPYGMPTDQYAHYQYSGHGQAMAKGNTDAATCVDCHGTHGIRRIQDPQSRVYPKNVPSTCGRCHGDAELMGKHGHKATSVGQYLESVHAELLLKKNDLSAPTCATCHGSHGATPPGFTDIAHVCGKCHVKQQEFFLRSPHAKLVESGEFLGCINCHGNHKVLRQWDQISKRCSKCHEESDKASRTSGMIWHTIDRARERHAQMGERLAAMTRAGHHTEEEMQLYEEAKTLLLQFYPVQHTLDPVTVVDQLATSHDDILKKIDGGLTEKERVEGLKKPALLVIVIFLVGMAVLFGLKKKSIERKEGRAS